MRFLSTLALMVLAFPPAALGHSSHRSHIVNTDGDTEIRIVHDDRGGRWASLRRDGVRYVTTDPAVVAEIEKAMDTHRRLSREHSLLGRRHSELGREHSRLGREHSRVGREHSRLGRSASRGGMTSDLEKQQRALEEEQRQLESKQRKLEDRQRQLEDQQRELETKNRAAERDAYRAIERIFDRAIQEGKAKRE